MNKCYLLLRNNKETGPFSIAELLQLSLTPKDLVWVQGKSAGWRYPAEIDELKEVLVTENLPLEPVANNKQEEPVAAGLPKERKTSPKKIFISLPAGKRKEAIVVAPSFEEKAEALRQKALNFSGEKKEDIEVNYTRSLTDIKEEYSGWIQEQKKARKRFSFNKPIVFTALFVGITAATFLALQWTPKKEKDVQTFMPAAKNNIPVTNIQANNAIAYKEVQNKRENVTRQLSKEDVPEKISTKTATKASSIKQPLSTPQKANDEPAIQAPKQTVMRQKEPTVPITDLMETTSKYIQQKEGIGLSVQLHNKSDKSIRVAAIDVIFFDKAKLQTAKETLYFSDVQPGSTVTKNSSYVKAASASYSIGLVSAENAGLYVMQ